MQLHLTKKEFLRGMKELKTLVAEFKYKHVFTCFRMGNWDYILGARYAEVVKRIQKKDREAKQWGLSVYKQEELELEEACVRRYLILDAFEQEVLATCKFQGE